MTGRPRAGRPTISDVARRAGVSIATVSYVMNGLPGVGSETRERILAIAGEMGWRPSGPARALTRARAGAVGLVLARDPGDLELDPFSVRFLAGVERALGGHDCALVLQMIAPQLPDADVAPYARLMEAGRVDGFLVTDPQHDDPRIAMLSDSSLPAVVVGQTSGPCSLPVLETDHLAGMAQAVEHLLSLGHRRIGFVGASESYEHVRARREIWDATMRQAGCTPGPVAYADSTDLTGADATAAVLDDPVEVTAIAYTTDLIAVSGMVRARELGRSVPATLSVTGLDDSPLAAPAGLTTVRIDYRGLGEGAAEHLMALITGAPPPPFTPRPAELLIRSSTAPPAPNG
jgi:LacI family transcriptional regulator, repressor for deo operon, udp, cdd, tsx, nupC, and nupG